MKLLLDTHTILWFVTNDPRLSFRARDLFRDGTNYVCLSLVSTWEMAIKVSLGKLLLAEPLELFLPRQLELNRIELLGITLAHTLQAAVLPFHHRDPFD